MRDFSKVSPAVWRSATFRALADDAKFLLLYFLTSAHQTSCGCFSLPDGYAIADLEWRIERYLSERQSLALADLIAVDPETSEILVSKWFRHNPPMNDSHRKAIVGAIEHIASPTLRARAADELGAVERDMEAKRAAKSELARTRTHGLLRTPHLTRVVR